MKYNYSGDISEFRLKQLLKDNVIDWRVFRYV